MARFPAMTDNFALLDAPGGGALLFEGIVRAWFVTDIASFEQACREARQEAAAGRYVVAALDYELGHLLEPRTGIALGTVARFWVFAERREFDASFLSRWLADAAGDPPAPAALAGFVPELDAADHADAIARIRDYIAAGDCYQVNFTFPFSASCIGDPFALYLRLRSAQPVACGGFVQVDGEAILSLSPELFVERTGNDIVSRPMKGTAARHADPMADAAARAALQVSAKDRAENVMIVDLIRNDLGRIAWPGSVHVDSLCEVESYPSVYQMVSSVRAESDADLATVLRAMFPCGSITGAPKLRAMQIIRELEASPRRLYTGALGWIGTNGDFRFNVAIRTLQVDASGSARMGVGSGIVWDSDASREYEECLLKARFVRSIDPGFRLIETMRLTDGVYPLLSGHLGRLSASAQSLGFRLVGADLEAALARVAAERPNGNYRLRLTLGAAGDIEISVSVLDATPHGQTCLIAAPRLDSGDPWLRHKTTHRARYDAELARVARLSGVFDAVFLNERGEVCEGARSNIFVRRASGGPLLTPPLACGLLPGVLRDVLLSKGEAVEQTLSMADLRDASELYLGNALRGLVPVTLMD